MKTKNEYGMIGYEYLERKKNWTSWTSKIIKMFGNEKKEKQNEK